MASIISGFRILGSVVLLFAPTYSVWFYLLYVVSGVTDILDGFVARKRNEASSSGAVFDSIADCVFFGACLWKLLPLYDIPLWLYAWMAIIIMLKLFNVLLGVVIHKMLVVQHTVMNKTVGFLLFVFLLLHSVIPFGSGAFVLCAIATFSALQEVYYTKTGKASN